jgi:hypothetical protein
MSDIVRLLPGEPLPPYSFVPGLFPHPTSDPRGHSYGHQARSVPAPHGDAWSDCEPYLRGIDLFNFGYYWEAHEAWESVWHACGRAGPLADFLKALIHLAAAGVKLREGRGDGAAGHARRAEALFNSLAAPRIMGLDVNALIEHVRRTSGLKPLPRERLPAPVEIVLPFTLRPAPTA